MTSRSGLADPAARTRVAPASARLDAVIHDYVLAALLLAGQGRRDDEASRLAGDALVGLAAAGEFLAGAGVGCWTDRIAETAERLGLDLELDVTGTLADGALADDLEAATREALTNVARHSGQRRARVAVTVAKDLIRVRITDPGRGFDIDRVDPRRAGLVTSIHGRVRAAGGEARVASVPGAGTTVTVIVSRAGSRAVRPPAASRGGAAGSRTAGADAQLGASIGPTGLAMLRLIAAGGPLDRAARSACLRIEAGIRDRLVARPLLDDPLAAAIDQARRRETRVEVAVDGTAAAAGIDGFRELLRALLPLLPAGCTIRATWQGPLPVGATGNADQAAQSAPTGHVVITAPPGGELGGLAGAASMILGRHGVLADLDDDILIVTLCPRRASAAAGPDRALPVRRSPASDRRHPARRARDREALTV